MSIHHHVTLPLTVHSGALLTPSTYRSQGCPRRLGESKQDARREARSYNAIPSLDATGFRRMVPLFSTSLAPGCGLRAPIGRGPVILRAEDRISTARATCGSGDICR